MRNSFMKFQNLSMEGSKVILCTNKKITRRHFGGFFFNNKESEICLSCTWNTYWSSSSSLPNMKAIHWRTKVTYRFEKRLTWDDARSLLPDCPDMGILKDRFFGKPVQKVWPMDERRKCRRNGQAKFNMPYQLLWNWGIISSSIHHPQSAYQGNSLNSCWDILPTRLKSQNFQRAITQENKFQNFMRS